jgi:hypothetical protein
MCMWMSGDLLDIINVNFDITLWPYGDFICASVSRRLNALVW